MSLIWSKNGFRGEYLARYIVSKFAFISESSVGEDYGIDFYCGLVKDCTNKYYVHYDKPFLLQIKTTTKKPDVVYCTKNSINTLYNLNLPFFIGHLDLKEKILEIYSTSMMWHTYLVTGIDNITRVTFRFSSDLKNTKNIDYSNPKIEPIKRFKKGTYKHGNKKNNIIDLGHPIVSLRLTDIDNPNNLKIVENCRTIISKCIDKEQANILNKNLKLFYYRWIDEYKTNEPKTFKFGYNFLETDSGIMDFDPVRSINALDHYLISLAISFKEMKDDTNYENVCKLTRMIKESQHLKNVKDKYPEIYIDKRITR